MEGITSVPGWSERMLDRRYAVDREAQSLRLALILAIKRSPVSEVIPSCNLLVNVENIVSEVIPSCK